MENVSTPIGQIASMPGDQNRDCPTRDPARHINTQEQYQQEEENDQYSELQQNHDHLQNIDNNSRNSNTTDIDDLINSTNSENDNHNQKLSQRHQKRLNRNKRSYRSNRMHNLNNGHWGDNLCNKEDDTSRIAYQNVNNFQTSHHVDSKMEQGKDWLAKQEIDVI